MQIIRDETQFSLDFPLRIHKVHLRKADNAQNAFHWHSFFEITYFESGSGTYYVNEKILPVQRGDFILFNNTEPHGWILEENICALVLIFPMEFVAQMEQDLLKPFLERGSNFQNLITAESAAAMEMHALMDEIYREYSVRATGYPLIIKANVIKLLALLTRYFTDHSKPNSLLAEKKQAMHRLENALAYMVDHFSEKITLRDMAALCFMSATYFSSYFKKHTGTTFSAYLMGIRIRQAQRLLRATSRSALDIALECGFHNMSHFYRMYKKYTGLHPGKERRQNS